MEIEIKYFDMFVLSEPFIDIDMEGTYVADKFGMNNFLWGFHLFFTRINLTGFWQLLAAHKLFLWIWIFAIWNDLSLRSHLWILDKLYSDGKLEES